MLVFLGEKDVKGVTMTLLYCSENRSIRLTFMPEWAGCAIQIRRRYLTNYSFANILWCTINDNYVFQYLKPFWPFFGQLYLHLWQNWGSDGHFEVLNRYKPWLVPNLWLKMQIFPFLFSYNIVGKNALCIFCVCVFCVFLVITIVPIMI